MIFKIGQIWNLHAVFYVSNDPGVRVSGLKYKALKTFQ